MCGIVGSYGFGGRSVDPCLLARQVSLLWHRGPDDQAIWHEDPVGLGATRLAIRDLSPAGSQPMHSADGRYVLVFNGEIYNTTAIRHALKHPPRFRGTSDTEVLLNWIAERGVAGFGRLEGMFAFACFDRVSRLLWIVRDSFGIKPLYYHVNGNRVAFSSEIKPLFVDPATPREPDVDALRQYLLFGYAISPSTAFRHIYKLPQGHYMEVRPDGSYRIREYWNVVNLMTTPILDIREAIDKSVGLHAMSDVPTGLTLSGGFDSLTLLSSMARQGLIQPTFRAFNVGLDIGQSSEDRLQQYERRDGVRVGAHYGVEVVRLSPVSSDIASPEAMMLSIEEPICDASNTLIDLITAAARTQGIRVVLTGHGGDEVFGGYRRHIWARYCNWFRIPGVWRLAQPILWAMEPELRNRISAGPLGGSIHPLISGVCRGWNLVITEVVNQDWFPVQKLPQTVAPMEALLKEWKSFSFLKQMMLLDMRTYLPAQNLINLDKASMRQSVEVRVPFLHRPLAAIGLQTPDSEIIAGLTSKASIRRAVKDSLPTSLRAIRKRGFGPPLMPYVRSEAGLELLLGQATRTRGLYSNSTIQHLLTTVSERRPHLLAQLTMLTTIEQWFRTFIDNNPLEQVSAREWQSIRTVQIAPL